jgi:hypothetical protein
MRAAYEKHIDKIRNRTLSEKNETTIRESKFHVIRVQENSLQPDMNKVPKRDKHTKIKRTKLVMEPIQTHKILSKRIQHQVETPKSTVTAETECQTESLPKEIIIETTPEVQSNVPWHSPKRTSHPAPNDRTNDVSPLRDPSLDGLEALAIRHPAPRNEHFLEKMVLSPSNLVAGIDGNGFDARVVGHSIRSKKILGINSQEASTMLDWPYLPVLNSSSYTRVKTQMRSSLPSENQAPQGRPKMKGKACPIRPIQPYEARHPQARKKNANPRAPPIDCGSV